MYIIAIEGLDKSGKHTAAETLASILQSEPYNLKVQLDEFPKYDTPTGKLIHAWLHHEWQVDDTTFELIQAADKQAYSHKLDELNKTTDVLILDRYIHSQLAYGSYKNDINWVATLIKNLRQPDILIYMDVAPETSMSRKGQHGTNDKYENDIKLLTSLKDAYNKAITLRPPIERYITINANEPIDQVTHNIHLIAKSIYPLLSKK